MKKYYAETRKLEKFIEEQSKEIKVEYYSIVNKLEQDGRLEMPFGEKIAKSNLFVIRVINAGNIRVFYVYGYENRIYGLHGYVKKSSKIPQKEMEVAIKAMKQLRLGGFVR